jgi:ferredoxin
MAYNITVDADACIGCGACAATCEKGFKMEDDKSVPVKASVKEISCEQEAADSCPTSCIKITEN